MMTNRFEAPIIYRGQLVVTCLTVFKHQHSIFGAVSPKLLRRSALHRKLPSVGSCPNTYEGYGCSHVPSSAQPVHPSMNPQNADGASSAEDADNSHGPPLVGHAISFLNLFAAVCERCINRAEWFLHGTPELTALFQSENLIMEDVLADDRITIVVGGHHEALSVLWNTHMGSDDCDLNLRAGISPTGDLVLLKLCVDGSGFIEPAYSATLEIVLRFVPSKKLFSRGVHHG